MVSLIEWLQSEKHISLKEAKAINEKMLVEDSTSYKVLLEWHSPYVLEEWIIQWLEEDK